jgi:hypothetical protein
MSDPRPADVDRASEAALLKAVHDAYLATAQGSLERATTRVNILTGAIASVTTLYTALLALVYAAEPGKGSALTADALIPALFLGCALFLVAIYAALFRRTKLTQSYLPTGIGGKIAETRMLNFVAWCSTAIMARAWAIHAGIVSFGLGIATLPIPFIELHPAASWGILAGGLLLVVLTALRVPARLIAWWRERGKETKKTPASPSGETGASI